MNTPLPFCNNLKKDDPVLDTVSNRPARVARTPQSDQQRMVALTFQGTNSSRYIDVMQLRLIVNGKPEPDAPVDGTPPPFNEKIITRSNSTHGIPTTTEKTPLQMLQDKRASNLAEIETMTKRATDLRLEVNRIDKAILALSSPWPSRSTNR